MESIEFGVPYLSSCGGVVCAEEIKYGDSGTSTLTAFCRLSAYLWKGAGLVMLVRVIVRF